MKLKIDEHTYQVAVFQWAFYMQSKHPELEMLVAIPNGGKRDKGTAQKLKDEGVKAGYPDMALNVARGGYNNLFIEMKVKGNYPTVEQKMWHEKLRKYGSMVVVCYSSQEAISTIENYLNECYIKG